VRPGDASDTEGLSRLTGETAARAVLGLDVPVFNLPVAAGRNLAVLVEAAVRNRVLQLRGIDSTTDFIERQAQHMREDGN
jgi:HPr kinase/phosphorylase